MSCLQCQASLLATRSRVPGDTADTSPSGWKGCPNCDHFMPPDAAKCPHCGYDLSTKYCPNCHRTMPLDAEECPKCGYDSYHCEY